MLNAGLYIHTSIHCAWHKRTNLQFGKVKFKRSEDIAQWKSAYLHTQGLRLNPSTAGIVTLA